MPRYPSQTCSRVSKRKLVFQTYLSGSTVLAGLEELAHVLGEGGDNVD